MQIKKLHKWDLSYAQARQLQNSLAGKLCLNSMRFRPKIVAGLDCAFSKDKTKIIAAVIVMRIDDLTVIETCHAVSDVTFPYIPGLLSFREAPVCSKAAGKLKTIPDVFLIDGQGIAHPRRLGLAAHLGLFFDKPTIGCAKSRLTGTFSPVSPEKGSYSKLMDKNEIVGAVLRTRTNVKPLFVSPGNLCSLKDAINITLKCTSKYRLPEPTRQAHQLVSKLRLQL